ncbi:MAG: porin family protein [Flavobacterium circumlabens]|uniref:Outer membrane protein with beta-barrel domain n=1 Tax=Flavobacterium circumlabens TaxID=2133765 RepID=A0A4Y7UKM8_9FLAO|nr:MULTISPECIES: porin family protein [Flavobacterium]QSB27273.1 PorT family protein [Flavobacterium sp. CLA17]TCN61134.1 outer membrane protein with beta-barrel domain [Flavobacterium circumlabens]TEB46239.1 PorT family protein [Flavobacterium circumlabens]
MKKLTLIAFVLFTGLVTSNAQVTVSPGLRGGLNLSKLSNIDDNGLKSDFYVGGLVDIKFNKYFTLQPELTYSRQGSEGRYFDDQNPNFGVPAKYELDYLTVGAVAKFYFGGKGFHILAGPSADFKTSDNFGEYGFDPIDFDLSIVAGLGYTLPNGLTFEARFKQGLIDIYGYDGLDYDDNGDYYYDDVILNQVFQIGISYTFKTK